MFIRALIARGDATPPACKPFTIHSNVCVGDLIAIIACSIAGIGFFFWAIHAIRKMRTSPFDSPPENKDASTVASERQRSRADSYRVQSQTLSLPDRVRTRLVLSHPEEEFYRPTAPISPQPYCECAQCSVTTPRIPPLAKGHSRRSTSRSTGRHASLKRGAPYGERYQEYGMNDDYVRNVSPPRARGSPPYKSDSIYRTSGDDPRLYVY